MKKLSILALLCVCITSCSSRKVAKLSIELCELEMEINEIESLITEEGRKISALSSEISELERTITSANKGISERLTKIEKLEQKIQAKKEATSKPRTQPQSTGRKPNEAPPGYKRFEVDRVSGVITY